MSTIIQLWAQSLLEKLLGLVPCIRVAIEDVSFGDDPHLKNTAKLQP